MQFWSLSGHIPYSDASRLQRRLVEARAVGALAEDVILFLEHTPVVTRGRGLQFTGVPRDRHMPAPAFLPPSVDFVESERGGDLTYHGPGQLVIYPIVKLDGSHPFAPARDITKFLRGFERVFIELLAKYGLAADARESATGVWVGDRKIASIGVAVRKWVTYHGLAINVVNDLATFQLFSPCGYASEVMTRLADLTEVSPTEWRARMESQLVQALSAMALGQVNGLAGSASAHWPADDSGVAKPFTLTEAFAEVRRIEQGALQFKPIDLATHREDAEKFRIDSFVVSFGNADKYYEAPSYLPWLERKIAKEPRDAVHVWWGDRLVGQMEFSIYRPEPTAGYVNLYYLAPEYRGHGWGRMLDEHAVNYLRGRGHSRAYLSVSPTNASALAYYERMGWHHQGAQPEMPGVLLMVRELN